jgi:hypothetical protein
VTPQFKGLSAWSTSMNFSRSHRSRRPRKLKIAYEDAAFQRQLLFVSKLHLEALARDYDAAVARRPAKFQKGGVYGLIGPSFAQYYLNVLGMVRKAGGISGSAAVVYKGQYRVPELALELHDLLGTGSPNPSDVERIVTEWLSYTGQGEDTEKLRGFPYIRLVEERFQADLARIRSK